MELGMLRIFYYNVRRTLAAPIRLTVRTGGPLNEVGYGLRPTSGRPQGFPPCDANMLVCYSTGSNRPWRGTLFDAWRGWTPRPGGQDAGA